MCLKWIPNKAANPFIIRNGKVSQPGTPEGTWSMNDTLKTTTDMSTVLPERLVIAVPLVHVSTPRRLYGMFPQSIECQMMHDNAGDFGIGENIVVPIWKSASGPKENWGVDDTKPNLTDHTERPPLSEWNHYIIECLGNEVKVWPQWYLINYGYDAATLTGVSLPFNPEGSEVELRKSWCKPT